MRTGVDLQDEDFDQNVERDQQLNLPLLGLCVPSVVQSIPQLVVEELVVQEFGFLLQRYTPQKMRFLCLKWMMKW